MAKGTCDIVFLVDATGSMGACIDGLKANLGAFIDSIESDAQSPIKDWRAAVVGFRDFNADGRGWLEHNDFVRGAAAVRAQLGSVSASGGGDEPESLLDALYTVATMEESSAQDEQSRKWRAKGTATRVVVVFSDATFHPTLSIPVAAGGTVMDVGNAVMARRLNCFFFAPGFPCYADLSMFDKAEHTEICPGDDPSPQQRMAEYSSNMANFQKVLKALGKTVTKSVAAEAI